MTPAETLRAAAASLRCEHSFPVLPPRGSLARPGICPRCGIRFDDREPVADRVREPLAKSLEQHYDEHSTYDCDWAECPTVQLARSIVGEVTA